MAYLFFFFYLWDIFNFLISDGFFSPYLGSILILYIFYRKSYNSSRFSNNILLIYSVSMVSFSLLISYVFDLFNDSGSFQLFFNLFISFYFFHYFNLLSLSIHVSCFLFVLLWYFSNVKSFNLSLFLIIKVLKGYIFI